MTNGFHPKKEKKTTGKQAKKKTGDKSKGARKAKTSDQKRS